MVAAPAPDHAIARGRAGAGLLAHIVVSKYDDHLPLYRQAEIFARDGVSLETSTLSGWVGATAAALQPLVDALAVDVLASDTLHVDDTPVPVLAPGTGKTKTGRLWTYVREGRLYVRDERPFGGARPPGGRCAVCRLWGFDGAAAWVGDALAGVVGGGSTIAVGSLSPRRRSTG